MAVVEVRTLALPDIKEIRLAKFGDERGFFSETWNKAALSEAGIEIDFVQDNHSFSSRRGVLRGLHYQLSPSAQDKLVRVSRGSIFDVAVDIRRTSPTFRQWVGLVVSAERWNQLFIPVGFAHGFLTLEPNCEVLYKASSPYDRARERSIRWDDPELAIDWPLDHSEISLSAKDRSAPLLSQSDLFE